jgi:hypothetical protein
MRRELTTLLALVALLAAAKTAAGTGANFSATSANPGNSFTAAASFGCTSGSQTVTASKDTYVAEDAPSGNFGTSSDLFVTSKTSANRRTLVGFNLPALPSGCSVTGATLRLFAASAVSGRTLYAYRAAASWGETTATWSNQPATTGSAASTTSGTGWRSWDVTSQVQAMYPPGSNNGFIVRDSTEGSAAAPEQKFDSRENVNDPQLIVSWG